MNMDDLKEEILEKKLRKHQTYETIYEKVVGKIKFTNSNTSNCYCIYEFKRVEFGIPRYNIAECISYICEKLRKAKFKVGLISQNQVMISWLHILEQQTQTERLINSQVSLMDLKERQELQHQQQFDNLLRADASHIKQSSHFGDTLQKYPLYNLNPTKPSITTIANSLPAIDYTKLNNASQHQTPPVSQPKIKAVPFNGFGNRGKKQKTNQEIQSSLELDNLLSQFDNNSLF